MSRATLDSAVSNRDDHARMPRAPLASVALALASGIVLDHAVPIVSSAGWAMVAVLGVIICLGTRQRPRVASLCLLGAVAALGAGGHHRAWSDVSGDELARVLADTHANRPAWVRGVPVEVPVQRHSQRGDGGDDYTTTTLAVTAWCDGADWHRLDAHVSLFIEGDRRDLRMGEPIEAAGTLSRVKPPLNPGQSDPRQQQRSRGVEWMLSVDTPSGVWADLTSAHWPAHRWLGRLRLQAQTLVFARLDNTVAPLASALLLGRRDAVDDETYDAFVQSGTLHLLAISGLHLQAMALAVGVACTLGGLDRKRTARVVLAITLAYTVLVGLRPSIVRSAAMTAGICLAAVSDRPTRAANLLALALLVTLAINPLNLFDPGAQLSFLAVAVLIWGVPAVSRFMRRHVPCPGFQWPLITWRRLDDEDPLDRLERRLRPFWKRWCEKGFGVIWGLLLTSTVVWVVTAPLVAGYFHRIAPVGIVLNVPLIPLTTVSLVACATAIALGLIWPPLAAPAAWIGTWALEASVALTQWGEHLPGGHWSGPGPAPGPWLLVLCLAAVAAAAAQAAGRPRLRLMALGVLLGWVALGLALPIRLARSSMSAQVLAVAHGLAVIVETPDGQVFLYDCGKLGDPAVGERVIARALWRRGITRIDHVILSHADSDHYNGLSWLADHFAITTAWVPPGFEQEPAPRKLTEQLRARGVTVHSAAMGRHWSVAGQPVLRVIHPLREADPPGADNNESLAVLVTWNGQSLLLTGDLERGGLARLIAANPAGPHDIIVAPHHGGRTGNPPELYAWGQPGLVIVSQAQPSPGAGDALAPLLAGGTPILRTWEQGAIQILWQEPGLAVSGFASGRRWLVSRPGRPPPDRQPAAAGVRLPARTLLVVMIASAILAGAVASLTWIIASWGAWALVRPARRDADQPPPPPPWRTSRIEASDGVSLLGRHRLAAPGSPGRWAILIHGFGEDGQAMISRAQMALEQGYHVLVIDQRGRGRSGGDWVTFGPAETRDVNDWLTALPALTGQGVDRLLVWGRSMGAAVAARLAADCVPPPRVVGVILESPYLDLRLTLITWLGRRHLPGWLAGMMLARARRLCGEPIASPPTRDLLPRLTCPVLILHGSADRLAPPLAIRRLEESVARGTVTVITVPGAGHTDVMERADASARAAIDQFLGQSL